MKLDKTTLVVFFPANLHFTATDTETKSVLHENDEKGE